MTNIIYSFRQSNLFPECVRNGNGNPIDSDCQVRLA